MKKKVKVYTIEHSPFYKRNDKLRAKLTELKASDGEEVVLARKRYFKQDEYTKFIVNQEFNISAYHKLPKMADTILMYILYHCIDYNTPSFTFKANDFSTIINSDISTIYKGIKALVDLKYIARTKTKETYWINHNLFYKGNFIIDKHLITKQ